MTEVPEPSMVDGVGALTAKAVGARRDSLTLVETTDTAVLALGGAGLLAVVLLAARRLSRR